MGVLDAPAPSVQKLRRASLLARLANAATLPVPAVAVTADQPTVSVSTTATVTGQLVGVQGGNITEVGSRGTWVPASGRLAVTQKSGLDFYLTGTTCEISLIPSGAGAQEVWIWVNGAPITSTPGSLTLTSGTNYIAVTFPSSARRRVEFFMPHSGAWYGVTTTLGSLLTPAPRKPVVAFVGDSFWGGSAGTSNLQCGSFLIARMLGVECFAQSLGGTGYVNAGSFNIYGSTTRVAAVAAGSPELILFLGSVNDDTSSASTIQTAATACYAAYAVACPTAPLIVFGPQPSNAVDTIAAARAASIGAVKAAAAAAPNVLAFHDIVGSAAGVPSAFATFQTYPDGTLLTRYGSVWKVSNGGSSYTNGPTGPPTSGIFLPQTEAMFGTGKVGSTTGDGTRDTYLYSDGVHPTPEGSMAMAIDQANRVRADLLAAAA